MSVFRRISALAVVCLASFCAAQLPDQVAAARVLGPHWRQIARVSGMIFSGTVLEIESQPAGKGTPLPLVVTQFRVDRAIAGVREGDVLFAREWAGAWSMQRPMTRGQRVLIFLYPPSRLGLTSPVGGRSGQVALDAGGEIAAANLRGSLFSDGGRTAEAVNSAAFTARLKSCPPEELSQTQALTRAPTRFRSQMDFRSRSNAPGAGQELERCANRNPDDPAGGTILTKRITLTQLERAIRSARKNPPAATKE